MSIARSVLNICLAAFLGGIVLNACTHLDRKPDHAESTGLVPRDPFSFPNTDIGAMLKKHMDAAVGHGQDAEAIYQTSLRALRARAHEVTPVLLHSYRTMPEQQSLARWLVVETLRELRTPLALEALHEISRAPIPEERRRDSSHPYGLEQETAIRVTAVEGLGLLAQGGDPRSDRTLLEFVKHGNLAVRRTAIRAYLAAGKDYMTRQSAMQRILPKEDHPLITLDTTDPTKIPYPDIPEKFDLRKPNGKNAPKIDVSGGTRMTRPGNPFPGWLGSFPWSDSVQVNTCYYQPNLFWSDDSSYTSRSCYQPFIHAAWDHFGFDNGDWDDGFGYEDPCNDNKPLARTFNALWLLAYSAEDHAAGNRDSGRNALRWGYPYSASKIDELDGRCGSGQWNRGPRATTYWGPVVDDRTVLQWPFFYGENVVQRAGTIVHEARHADGKGHDGGNRCPRGSSCDSSWTSYGSNTYQVLFLWWFYLDGTRTTTAIRNRARIDGQSIIDRGFVTRPPYTL